MIFEFLCFHFFFLDNRYHMERRPFSSRPDQKTLYNRYTLFSPKKIIKNQTIFYQWVSNNKIVKNCLILIQMKAPPKSKSAPNGKKS